MTAVSEIGFWGYVVSSLAYLAVVVQLALAKSRHLQTAMLLVACLGTVLWASSVAYLSAEGRTFFISPDSLEVLQRLLWILFLSSLLRVGDRPQNNRMFVIIVACLVIFVAVSCVLEISAIVPLEFSILYRLVMAIVGLVILENIFRNKERDGRWRIKFLAIGLGSLFLFDIFYYSNAAILGGVDQSHFEARGWVHALAAPFIGITAHRNEYWSSAIALSRQVVFYSTTVLLVGVFIVTMAGAAFLIRELGGDWGTSIQLTFLFSAFLLLLVLLSSGTYRAHVKVFINKHFFHYRYDYRDEWLKFTKATADSGSALGLEDRILRGIADLMESPSAVLWLRDGPSFSVIASWNMAATSFPCSEAEQMAEFMKTKEWVLTIASGQAGAEAEQSVEVPRAIKEIKDAWVLVPLLHLSDLVGFVLIGRPRAPRSLTWEDFDLLRTVGRQASGYLAERQMSAALAEARQFERFNRRSAFVLHDIKNLVSQLKLMADNLDRHGENPEFRQDMSLTVTNVVNKMQKMISRLSDGEDEAGSDDETAVGLATLLREVVGSRAELSIDPGAGDGLVNGDSQRLSSLFGHLLDNAREAAGDGGWVRVNLFGHPRRFVVEVSDSGPGMDEAFVKHQLFTPFRSTKPGGFGIGLYQCRDYAREMGGDLDVITSPGSGTTIRVSLPRANDRSARLEQVNVRVS